MQSFKKSISLYSPQVEVPCAKMETGNPVRVSRSHGVSQRPSQCFPTRQDLSRTPLRCSAFDQHQPVTFHPDLPHWGSALHLPSAGFTEERGVFGGFPSCQGQGGVRSDQRHGPRGRNRGLSTRKDETNHLSSLTQVHSMLWQCKSLV